MDIRPIRSEDDYEDALREIGRLMDSEPAEGSEEFDTLDVLVTLVEDYERKNHAIGPASPVETIEFHLERLGISQAKLAREAGVQASHLSAVLNGRRKLSLTQIQKLSAALDIPMGRLIDNPYADETSGWDERNRERATTKTLCDYRMLMRLLSLRVFAVSRRRSVVCLRLDSLGCRRVVQRQTRGPMITA